MNEGSLAESFRKRLREHGGFTIRHADSLRRGIPDTSSSANGVTVWLEFKATWVTEFEATAWWPRLIRKKDMTQLATMLALEEHAKAIYILFQMKKGTTQSRAYWCLPSTVMDGLKAAGPSPLDEWDWNDLSYY